MFTVESNNETINLSVNELLELLLKKAFLVSTDDTQLQQQIDQIILLLNDKLSENHLELTNKQIYSIYFMIGYYFKVFLEKNKVTYNNDKA